MLQRLEDPYDCKNCISGNPTAIEDCTCGKESAACVTNESIMITALFSQSQGDCILHCFANEKCSTYTWYSEDNEEIQNTCVLYSSCNEKEYCNSCYSGSINCQDYCADIEYNILDESDRNVEFNDGVGGITYYDMYDTG